MNYARSSERKSSDSCWPLVRADGLPMYVKREKPAQEPRARKAVA